jgi:hypothetical protein
LLFPSQTQELTMYASPSGRGTPMKRSFNLPDGPIADFHDIIEQTPTENWQKRSAALRKVVDLIPEGPAYFQKSAWYNSPPILRHLAIPIGELIKDARSTVVKRTCESLTRLFAKCRTNARYLFKDIMSVIILVHGQTVQVIRTAVQNMVVESIPEVPCKMVMPLWMDRLKLDKSRTIREACAIYLGHALFSWTEDGYLTDEIWLQVGNTLIKSCRDPSPHVRTHAKQALERLQANHSRMWDKLVNEADVPVSRDKKTQRWLLSLGRVSPDSAEELSVASKFSYNSDSRFARSASGTPTPRGRNSPFSTPTQGLERGMDLNVPMNISVASNSTPPSLPKPKAGKPNLRVNTGYDPVPRVAGAPPRPATTTTPTKSPDYLLNTIEDAGTDSAPEDIEFPTDLNTAFGGRFTPSKEMEVKQAEKEFPADLNLAYRNVGSEDSDEKKEPPELEETDSFDVSKGDTPEQSPMAGDTPKSLATVRSEDTDAVLSEVLSAVLSADSSGKEEEEDVKEEDGHDGPFIGSMQELKKHASQRRSRNSILMQERFRQSATFDDSDLPETGENGKGGDLTATRSEEENEVPNSEDKKVESKPSDLIKSPSESLPAKSPLAAPEHMIIAIRLLRAHKAHVDQIMETLKIEMDTLRDFDKLLEEAGRPTEEEVLDYFEGVGLCLDQRTQAGTSLQHEMDRISQGIPPE